MFSKIKQLLESIVSPDQLSVLSHYGKPTPDYKLDQLIELAKKKGYNLEVVKSTNDYYLVDVKYGNELVNTTKIYKMDLLTDKIDLGNIVDY